MERTIPIVWAIDGRRRVLKLGLQKKDEVLLLLYSNPGRVREEELLEWVEHSNASVFRDKILKRLHKDRLIEFDEANGEASLRRFNIR